MASIEEQSTAKAYWSTEIESAKKRFLSFWKNGDETVDAYRMQKSDNSDLAAKDKFNILYSSTETISPNLYAQRPKTRVKLRNKDMASDGARLAAKLLEGSLEYVIEEVDFDEIMTNVVEDYLLPGLGTAWVRYDAKFEDTLDESGKPVLGEDGQPQQKLLDEMVQIDYVYWQDWLCGVSRGWKTVPWVARRLWLTKEEATKRFGKKMALQLQYAKRDSAGREENNPSETAEVWEIWDKRSKTVYWYADCCPQLLDVKKDPLKLKNFFPCPRPLRAIYNNRTFVPRSLYSQYKSQAETLNVLTKRIRLLGEALRVVGLYDGSNAKLADVLNPAAGNRMIAVDSWAMFAQQGGLKGSVEWLPIEQIVTVLIQLQQAREVAKNEIYEITGFSDIVRGVSKASETLGAQNIKQNWAGARVRKMQNEVQRFARDLIAIAGEIIAEHCEPETIALFSAMPIPDPQAVQADPDAQAHIQAFMEATALIRSDARRCAQIDIETDSTLLANEEAERKDRTEFMASAGAFLQQAVPAIQATPELGPLLGAMLMFGVRTFPASRPIEEEFEKVQKVLEGRAAAGKPDEGKGEEAKAQAAMQAKQMDTETAREAAMLAAQSKDKEIAARSQSDAAKLASEAQAEENRHTEAMAKLMIEQQALALKEREVAVKEAELELKRAELSIKQQQADTQQAAQEVAADTAEHNAMMAEAGHEQEEARMEQTDRHEYDKLEQADRHEANSRALTEGDDEN